ncbi:hypothetical protein DFH08DRAFT_979482 [Mycena albidolilacea]|uniref:BTB domain-containing protein n=1 Tax=Mycena albidolilacea TaxID=1033008 RepID=A0AAD6YWD2_9AGAR|nr:hypothetical protein DFH08DRAFT_979482 [Mycena albidolilacea]
MRGLRNAKILTSPRTSTEVIFGHVLLLNTRLPSWASVTYRCTTALAELDARKYQPVLLKELLSDEPPVTLHSSPADFPVSQSTLAARSTVFRVITVFPQTEGSAAEMVDASPMVHLHDAAALVEVFLRAILNRGYLPSIRPPDTSDDWITIPLPAVVDVRVALVVLQLAHKYDVDCLFCHALQHLSSEYPCDISLVIEQATAIVIKVAFIAQGLCSVELLQPKEEVVGDTWPTSPMYSLDPDRSCSS